MANSTLARADQASRWQQQPSIGVPPLTVSCQRAYRGPVPAVGRRRGHCDDLLALWKLEQGSGSIHWAGQSLALQPGYWLLVPPGLRRDQLFSADACLHSLALQVTHQSGVAPWQQAAPVAIAEALLDTPAEAVSASWRREPAADMRLHCRQTAALGQLFEAVLNGIAGHWTVAIAAGCDPRLRRVLAVALTDLTVDWPRWEGEAGCSRRQLDRLAHRYLQTSLRAWLDEQRLVRAYRLLRTRRYLLKEMANMLGFANASDLSRWFRRRNGISPRAWQRIADQWS